MRASITASVVVLISLIVGLLQLPGAAAQTPPRLSEAVSINASGLVDSYGSTSDWIEIYNPDTTPLDLSGWGLSDDAGVPLRWVFPAGTTLAADGYLVVFASGEATIGGELHASFSLSGDGEQLTLAQPDGSVVSVLDVPQLLPDHSYGVTLAGSLQIYATPTPGAPNGGGAAGILADAVATPDRGYYANAVQVTLTHPDAQAEIRYTTGATAPTAATGTVYAGPITINATTTLRVAAFRNGWVTGKPVTHTYVFAADVPTQPAMYGPNVDTEGERQLVIDGLNAVPTISIVTDQGINQVDRVGTSVEWIDPAGGAGFQVDAGIQEVGGTSVRYPKDGWRLAFDSEWGESSLDFPVFDGFESQGLIDPTDEFKRLTLRTGSHDTGFWPGSGFTHRGSWVRGRWGDETMLELGHVNTHGRWVNVYLNGQYWGQYHVREHFNDHFMESYFGGDNSDYLGVNRGVVSNGSGDGWDAAVAAAGSWTTWKEWVDPVAYVDFMLINEFQGNFWDVRELQNWRGAGQSSSASTYPGFIFQGSDQDITFALPDRATRFTGGPAGSWGALRAEKHPDFVALVNDRVQALLRGDGVLTSASAIDRWQRMATQIEASMHAELARWAGSYGRTKEWATWRADIDWLATNIIALRTDYTLDRMAATYGLLSAVEAPVIADDPVPSGSVVAIGNPNDSGEVYVTLDGTDPRLDGGAVSPTAAAMTEVVVDRTLSLQARVLANGEWSPIVEVTLVPVVDPNAPVIQASQDLTTVDGFTVRHQMVAADPNGDLVTFSAASLPAGVTIDAQTGVISGVPTGPGTTTVIVTASDGQRATATAFDWTVVAHGGPAEIALVLNEYNAVKSSEVLADGGVDAAFGPVVGNGGDWIELLVTQDDLDLRGWSVELWDRENGPLELRDTIVFTDAAVLSQVMSGTIITIAESQPEDPSYDPRERDWTINARSATGVPSVIVTDDAGNFDSNRHSFRVRIRDAAGVSQSPFMGETDEWRSFGNVGGDEVYARCDAPTPDGHPAVGDPRDTNRSTFGQPNDCGDAAQDLVDDRDGFRGDADCDGEITVVDALAIARYGVSNAGPAARCDVFAAGQAFALGGDFNDDGATNVIDGLLLSQCVVGIVNDFCHD
jgi:hypothetical protein